MEALLLADERSRLVHLVYRLQYIPLSSGCVASCIRSRYLHVSEVPVPSSARSSSYCRHLSDNMPTPPYKPLVPAGCGCKKEIIVSTPSYAIGYLVLRGEEGKGGWV